MGALGRDPDIMSIFFCGIPETAFELIAKIVSKRMQEKVYILYYAVMHANHASVQ